MKTTTKKYRYRLTDRFYAVALIVCIIITAILEGTLCV